ncbi:uncharacterized protein LOC130795820 isoform X3 [Actinidia eriantha]|uniref:uncharacterized protein LOC130795820 isoform X3 n=1 Tax=Actinidia eriantha TaxID=165200 RepID=UPI00258F342D|nr:uncharacterized protein LOC130795820 isoform X3 [Actinidia eriantha]
MPLSNLFENVPSLGLLLCTLMRPMRLNFLGLCPLSMLNAVICFGNLKEAYILNTVHQRRCLGRNAEFHCVMWIDKSAPQVDMLLLEWNLKLPQVINVFRPCHTVFVP